MKNPLGEINSRKNRKKRRNLGLKSRTWYSKERRRRCELVNTEMQARVEHHCRRLGLYSARAGSDFDHLRGKFEAAGFNGFDERLHDGGVELGSLDGGNFLQRHFHVHGGLCVKE